MTLYLLDTDTISHTVRGSGHVRAHLAATPLADLAVSTITLMELEYGLSLKASKRAQVEASLGLWLPQVSVLDFSAADVRVTASIRVALKQAGTPIGPYDLLNAGMAIARGLTLVTHNTGEYQRVSGLGVADWVTTPHDMK